MVVPKKLKRIHEGPIDGRGQDEPVCFRMLTWGVIEALRRGVVTSKKLKVSVAVVICDDGSKRSRSRLEGLEVVKQARN